MHELHAQIQQNYQQVCEQIDAALSRAHRHPGDVRLVVVTKTHPVERIQSVIEAGAKYLGENYADEALPKIRALNGYENVEWHMIGHVQSRKSGLVSQFFHYFHALDSLKLASRINHQCAELPKPLPVLLECNISQEESKFGFPAWDEDQWPALAEMLHPLEENQFLAVHGLMAMAPYSENPETSRPHFRRLRRLQDFLRRRLKFSDWDELSMGMSGDFEVAIEEGATWVRIGTRIMGERKIV